MFLQSMREKTQSIFAYIIIGLLILSFALWGISSYFHDGFSNSTVAKVNGDKITYESFSRALNQYNQSQQMTLGAKYNPDDKQKQMIKNYVLSSIISRTAISQYVADIGFALSRSQVDSALFTIPAFQQSGEFSPELLKNYLASQGLSASAFIADFSTNLAVTQWQQGLVNSTFFTTKQLNNQVSLLQQKRTLAYTTINIDKSSHPVISEAQIKEYYNKHAKQFVTPEQVKISYVEVDLDNIARKIHPTNEQLENYYRKHSSRYAGAEQWQVNIYSITDEAQSLEPKQLQKLAEQASKSLSEQKPLEESENIKLAQKQIWLNATNLNADVKSILSNMKKKNMVTEPVPMASGFVIYQVINYQPAKHISFDTAKADIKKAYIQEQATEKYSAIADKMTNIAYEQPDSLKGVAQAAATAIQTSSYFPKSGSEKGITSDPTVSTAAYSDDVLLGKNNTDLIKLDGNKILVLRVADHKQSKQKTLNDVNKQIKQILVRNAQSQEVANKALKIKTALIKSTYQEVAKQFSVKFTKKDQVGRFTQLSSDGVLQQAFALGKNQSGIVALENGDAVVLKVLDIIPGDASNIADKDKAMYENMLSSEWSNATMAVYADAVIKAAKVKRNEQVLDKI